MTLTPDMVARLSEAGPFTHEDIRRGSSIPDTWACVDCGVNTAPGMATAQEILDAFNSGRNVKQKVDNRSEIYTVLSSVWKEAGRGDHDGCLCVCCLEQRIGRKLNGTDFLLGHPFNAPSFPKTRRLRGRIASFAFEAEAA